VKIIPLFYSLLLLFVLGACSMNADQEASLNSAMNEYIDAINNDRVSMRVRLTYPDAVRYYRNLGDEAFIYQFKPENNLKHYQDGRITQIESKGKVMHVEYEYIVIKEDEDIISTEKEMIYAVSLDEGAHWKFMNRSEYTNDKILPKSKRLI